MSTISFSDCPNLYYSKGHKIGCDPGYPEMAWGSYLPGDEPGYRCKLSDESCGGDPELDKCERMEKTEILCPCNFEEDCEPDKDLILWLDDETKEYYCPEEDTWYGISDVDTSKTIKEVFKDDPSS